MFPFRSRRTIQATFRRLRLGIVERTQAHNRSRWDKIKWYTINRAKLSHSRTIRDVMVRLWLGEQLPA